MPEQRIERDIEMKDVRIEPISSRTVTARITCECGCCLMRNVQKSNPELDHAVTTGRSDKIELLCECGRAYELRPQADHVHVTELPLMAGLEVVTTTPNTENGREWSITGRGSCEWGEPGTIAEIRREPHGLIYMVRHGGQSQAAPYDPSEIRLARRRK